MSLRIILAMIANAFDVDRQACLAAGMNDPIAKLLVPQKPYEILLAWLEKPLSALVGRQVSALGCCRSTRTEMRRPRMHNVINPENPGMSLVHA
jgi:hypothetical protein